MDDDMRELLERFGDRLDGLERSLKTGTTREQGRQVRRLEDEFSEEELSELRETREYGRFRRMLDRYAEEIEAEAEREHKKAADDDDPDDDPDDDGPEDDDPDDGDAPKQKAKPKPAAKRKPAGGRHPQPVEDELPTDPPSTQSRGPFAWLLRD